MMSSPREILQAYRHEPPMDDLNPVAWEEMFLKTALSELALWIRSRKDCRDGSMSTREAYNLALEDIAKSMEEEA